MATDGIVTIDVLGTPAPKGSSRAFYKAGMKRAVIVKDNSDRQKSWDASVRDRGLAVVGERSAPVFVGLPLRVEIEFRLARPAGHWSKRGGLLPSAPAVPIVKPDPDKLARSTLDALTGLVYDDDSRIVELSVCKVYAAPGREGARIMISEWRLGRGMLQEFLEQISVPIPGRIGSSAWDAWLAYRLAGIAPSSVQQADLGLEG